MKFDYVNNHIIVKFDNHNLIVDTGSPWSFSLNSTIKNIVINNVSYPLPFRANLVDKESVEKLVGTNVDGFLGMDILRLTNMTICFVERKISFEAIRGDVLCFLENSEMVCTKDLTINDNGGFLVIIDSGAKINYVSEEYVRHSEKQTDGFEDWNPSVGKLSGDLYDIQIGKVTMGSGSYCCKAKAGVVRKGVDTLKIIGAGAILNAESLIPEDKTCISFDFVSKTVFLL